MAQKEVTAGALILAILLAPFVGYIIEGFTAIFKPAAPAVVDAVEKINKTAGGPPDPAAASAAATLLKVLEYLLRVWTNPWFIAALLGVGAVYAALTR